MKNLLVFALLLLAPTLISAQNSNSITEITTDSTTLQSNCNCKVILKHPITGGIIRLSKYAKVEFLNQLIEKGYLIEKVKRLPKLPSWVKKIVPWIYEEVKPLIREEVFKLFKKLFFN